MSSKSSQKALISEFCDLTGAPEKLAQKFLKAAAWQKDVAVDKPTLITTFSDSYFTSATSGTPSQKNSLSNLFEQYHESKDEKDKLGVDGVMRYLGDLGVDLATAEIFIPLEIVKAPGLGEITKSGFVDGWGATGQVSNDQLSKQKKFVASQIKKMSTDDSLFKRVYRHAFFASKEISQKAIPLENAIIYWTLLFNPPGKRWASESVDWLQLWTDFLQENWTKTVNKDMWNQTLEFFQKSMQDESLSFWSEDGAWPGVIDDFVAYVKPKLQTSVMETD
ncbi:Bgt-3023 [Blumeria graminis f. sp. tritici]|uniref:Defective in cullin neddylation protein n=2 Tax=Blumeria graminis f. sp. tritici TaxID=62690 RepID=A0A061HM45_BLUGR|nr:Nedd8 ligase [Blumeria graminis f. sp. tritici 96224]VDB94941.1 Bgt-3023 [Blumeria graminis f. sp. tritici]